YCARLLDKVVEQSEASIELPNKVIYREFGDGAMNELDQFSEIIWPNKLRRFRQSTHGSFVGVGILIRHDEKREIMVVSPLEGTPAYFAGVKPDDRIAKVDGATTAGWSLNDAVDKITGRKGTEVELGIRREGVE
ncbi:MAG: PDZ domain-containing protein, partial [Acidobacteria bacterium]|nr:PDZ domain-containing protein [Acidobacteriota bacterium]NIO60223.1 PDZ domain-containing protein [Acidobacteriota bacterium]NIQ86488.1 PDZ domain-containing protein [Acidobacteriota bacterium]